MGTANNRKSNVVFILVCKNRGPDDALVRVPVRVRAPQYIFISLAHVKEIKIDATNPQKGMIVGVEIAVKINTLSEKRHTRENLNIYESIGQGADQDEKDGNISKWPNH